MISGRKRFGFTPAVAAGPLKSSVCAVVANFVAFKFSSIYHFDINFGLVLFTITLSLLLFEVYAFVNS